VIATVSWVYLPVSIALTLKFCRCPQSAYSGWICVPAHQTYWPCDLHLWPINPKSISLRVYPKIIPYTKFEHLGLIRFWVMLRTNRQTGGLEYPTHNPLRPYINDIVRRFLIPCITSPFVWCSGGREESVGLASCSVGIDATTNVIYTAQLRGESLANVASWRPY